MSEVFVDTSALMALLVKSDANHPRALRLFERLRERKSLLVTTSYVLVETYALLGRRHGIEQVRSFRERLAPLLAVIWIGPELHEGGLDLLFERSRKKLSLVDATSFLAMRARGINEVFAYDEDFSEEGFRSPG
jgi:predicted nucleic acid-binding protein